MGDNGIITNAMNAKQKNGIAALEEFLQQKYVERYEEFEENNNRIVNFVQAYPEYFYIPRENGFGMLDYIEYNGKAFYLIEKKSLPEEIREQLIGGDAGEGKFTDYVSLNDVYGVNSSLKVYYCSGGLDSIQNLGKDDVDNAVERDVFKDLENSGLGKLLSLYDSNKDGKIQSSEVSSIKQLEITEPIDLKEIYNLYSLEKLIINEVSNVDLTGIENCMKLNYIWFYKGTAKSYEPIGKLGSKLTQLYFSHITNDSLNKVCEDLSSYDLSGLTHLGLFDAPESGTVNYGRGPERQLGVTSRENYGSRGGNLTTISYLSKLKAKTSLKYLWLYGDNLESLTGIEDFTNLYYINAYGNSLGDINGLKKLTNIEYLRLANNNFADEDEKQGNESDSLYVLQNLKKLIWLDISTNTGIKYISYLSGIISLRYLYMDGCSNLFVEDVVAMNGFINDLTDKSYDSKYSGKLIDTSKQTNLSYYNQQIDVSEFKVIGQCTKLQQLNLRNSKIVKGSSEVLATDENTVEKLMEKVFKNLTSLKYLGMSGLTINLNGTAQKISDITFLPSSIVLVDIRDSNVVARGDTSSETAKLDNTTNQLSIKNTEKLNGLVNLDSFLVNTDKFDFSKLQPMVNRLGSKKTSLSDVTLTGGTSTVYGVICYNWTSLETLEKCDKIENLICETHTGGMVIGGDKFLDLSGCNNLEYFWVYPWDGLTVKFPNCIKDIYQRACVFSFDFEAPEVGKKIELDTCQLDQINYSAISSQLKILTSHNIYVDYLDFSSISPEANKSIINDLLVNGICNWIRKIRFLIPLYNVNVWSECSFYKDLYLLKDSSIEEFDFVNCSEKDLNFVKDFKNLKKLSITSSKITDISAIVPKYDGEKYISGLPNLEELNLSSNSITNISSVGTLSNLKKITMSSNPINSGIESLENLTNLEYIDFNYCNSLSQNQSYVDVANGNGTDIFVNIFKNLHQTGNLKELYLNGTGIKNIKSKLNVSPEWKALQCDS